MTQQHPTAPLEIIVVDNNRGPSSVPEVVAEFPQVRLLKEPRPGSAYARNKGFTAARGNIVATTDDDVIAPADWLAQVVRCFSTSPAALVTGNVVPLELKTPAQRRFEAYGGLGNGRVRRLVQPEWLRRFAMAAPTWYLGAGANMSFRSDLLSDRGVAFMDEALGTGMPAGGSDDTYLFYKVLQSGSALLYEPNVIVWHKHRRDMPALRRQIYAYGKGHVAYLLTVFLRDRERGALLSLLFGLPVRHLRNAGRRMIGRSEYPLGLILVEALGNLVGPWTLWTSRRRVARDGRSERRRG